MVDAVVDIGNSRIKFCRCYARGLVLPVRGLSTNDPTAWDKLVAEWDLLPLPETERGEKSSRSRIWAVASTHPPRRTEFISWAEARGDHVRVLDSTAKVPIGASVDEPGRVGIDRLLNALAAKSHLKQGQPAILVDAGSAVTVDLLDEHGNFAGGTIFPGLRLMALALREHTAQLPLVDLSAELPSGPPGKNTVAAMHLGILHAVAGGIDAIIRELASRCTIAPTLFLTGGDMSPKLAGLMQSRYQFATEVRSTLTLEGIFLAASRVP
ncbi:MAG: type III pantothenate kinase [Gemmataceae bacterium]|nr:type III pantothenate kinase [Gemmataceae bacterium]